MIVINAKFLSFKVIDEIMHLFPNVHCYQIRMDMLKRFMALTYAYIERLKDLNAPYAVEISCLESLFQIRADVISSVNKYKWMDCPYTVII